MSDVYRIYGAELSPFSVKIRSYFRYKQIPHQWIQRDAETTADYQKYAKIPIMPLVVTPDEQGLQDSTPIMEAIDERFPAPSTHPRIRSRDSCRSCSRSSATSGGTSGCSICAGRGKRISFPRPDAWR